MLKKVSLIFTAIILILITGITNTKPVFGGFADNFDCYEIYTSTYSSTENIIAVTTLKEYLSVAKKKGESCRGRGDASKDSIFSAFNARLIYIEETKEGTSYYGYSNKIKYQTEIKGGKVNLHVFVAKDYIKVGSPIIFGSF